jgi:hypothetical protein
MARMAKPVALLLVTQAANALVSTALLVVVLAAAPRRLLKAHERTEIGSLIARFRYSDSGCSFLVEVENNLGLKSGVILCSMDLSCLQAVGATKPATGDAPFGLAVKASIVALRCLQAASKAGRACRTQMQPIAVGV